MLHKPIIIFATISVNVVYTLGVPINREFIEPTKGQLLFPRVDPPPHIPSNLPPSSLQGLPIFAPPAPHPAVGLHDIHSSIRREQDAYVESVITATERQKHLASSALFAGQPATKHDIPAKAAAQIEHNFAYAYAEALHRHVVAKAHVDAQHNSVVTQQVRDRVTYITDKHRDDASRTASVPRTTARLVAGIRPVPIFDKRHPTLNPDRRAGAPAGPHHQIGSGSQYPHVAGVAAAAERERQLASNAIAAANPANPSPHDLPADVATHIAHNHGYARAVAFQDHTDAEIRRIGSLMHPALTSDLLRQAGKVADSHHGAAARNASILPSTARYMAGISPGNGPRPGPTGYSRFPNQLQSGPSKAEEQGSSSKRRKQ